MKSVIRNFIYVLRRFKTATFLNILGLSVAFVSFMVIMMQVNFDSNFDKDIVNADCIYRVEVVHKDGSKQGIICRPISDILFQSSPHILAGTITNFGSERFFLKPVSGNNSNSGFQEEMLRVTSTYTDVFHFDMIEGSDKALSEPGKILIPASIAHKIWRDEHALNKQLKLEDNTIYTIGGVYKDFPKNTSLLNVIYYKMPDDENIKSWGNSNYNLFIQVDSPEAVNSLSDTFRKYAANDLNNDWKDVVFQFTQLPELHYTTDVLYDRHPKSSRQTIAILFAIAFVIVIIAGVNFTNFSMALTPARIRSINTQKVLGATETELRIILLIEAVCTAIVAFILSVLWLKLVQYSPIQELINADIAIMTNLPLIILSALLALIIGIVSGIYPAFYMTSFPPALVLKGNFGLSGKGRKMRNILIGFQFIASLALIMSAGLMYMQNHFMQNSALGYNKEELIIVGANSKVKEKWDLFKTGLKSHPEIKDVTGSMILLSSSEQYMGWGMTYKEKSINFQCIPVDYSFLDAMGIKVSEGRNFVEDDAGMQHSCFIFNEKAKAEYDLELNSIIDSMEIIGFVPDLKFATFRTEVAPMAFYLITDKNNRMVNHVYVKTSKEANPYVAIETVKKVLDSIDPDYPYNIRFFDDALNNTYQKEKKLSLLITTFSLIAILISIVGVFGLVIFESEYRRKEISIRKVMGSSINEILLLFNKTYIKILVVCFILATPLSYYIINRWLENFAYRTPIHWWVFLTSGAIISLIVIATVSWQSWKTANMNPVDSLKNE
ncbi:MAG: ABC transporter permease [Prevotella sp.]|jgi:putative ABC transport system permease protein|nr:ABC transporter permease [Prevotella sp.]